MKIIKVESLRNLQKDVLKEEYIDTGIQIDNRTVYVKKYTPIENKISILRTFYKSIYNVEGISPVIVEVLRKTRFIKEYTNINIPKDDLEAYNILQSTGILNDVLNAMCQNEREEIKRIEMLIIKEFEDLESKKYINDTLTAIIPTEDGLKSVIKDAEVAVNTMDKDVLSRVQSALTASPIASPTK